MNIEISELAQKELDDAVLYYEMEQSGLGQLPVAHVILFD